MINLSDLAGELILSILFDAPFRASSREGTEGRFYGDSWFSIFPITLAKRISSIAVLFHVPGY